MLDAFAQVVLPDGEVALVAASMPVGVEGYVDATLCFLDWALTPAAVREQEAQAQAYVQVIEPGIEDVLCSAVLCFVCMLWKPWAWLSGCVNPVRRPS